MADLRRQADMRKVTGHSLETRIKISRTKLQQRMPPEEFARMVAANGELKWCSACSQLKPPDEFHKSKNSPDGRYWCCKPCNSARNSAAYVKYSLEDPDWLQKLARREAGRRAAGRGTEKLRRRDKNGDLKKHYGITIEQFEGMAAKQHYCCAICRRPFPNSFDTHVDHDHACDHPEKGAKCCPACVRGLLCNSCNNGLGRFRDDPAVLRRAASYLERASRRTAASGKVPA